ncbi:MaoC/PaaZ C-terminal domain-containing protein [Alteromonas halophila]|uniref:MaoC-like domain-containing protein n=1 Tax=Alteromonas halophila TaxID=516698 RepID=A0A918MZD7_9ALTE|nr:MaoC/PaaZ C-terminal domain-containing protein [Alteromonas halophila]GGW89514.1 hypothetical protein GCM10007391_24740 [Alteromonas halophila]
MKTLLQLEVGDELQQREWHDITQHSIDQFAEATNDHQWIHTDPQRCEQESPFGTTIAHGFFTASLMPKAFDSVVADSPQIASVINYGVDSLRFLEPVRCNDAIRFSFRVTSIHQKRAGHLYKIAAECELRDAEKLAMAGTFLMLVIPK